VGVWEVVVGMVEVWEVVEVGVVVEVGEVEGAVWFVF
jgi:hypothetical protein